MKKKNKTHEEKIESFFKVEGDLLDRWMRMLKYKGKMKFKIPVQSRLRK